MHDMKILLKEICKVYIFHMECSAQQIFFALKHR